MSYCEDIGNKTNRDMQINIALDECEHIARRLRWLKEQPSDPRIQAVIDAARELACYDAPHLSARGKSKAALESALAALDTQPTKDDEWPRYFGHDDHGEMRIVCFQSVNDGAYIKESGHTPLSKTELGYRFFEQCPSWTRLTLTEAQARITLVGRKP